MTGEANLFTVTVIHQTLIFQQIQRVYQCANRTEILPAPDLLKVNIV